MNPPSLRRFGRAHPLGASGLRRFAACVAAVLAAWTLVLHMGCLGGSTGVDNPGLAELPVEFRGPAGDVALVQGTLEIYAWDHNPAVTSEPLLSREVLNSANNPGLRLTRADFDRIDSARAAKVTAASWKRSAGALASGAGSSAGPAEPDSLIRFNLVFRGGSGSGAVAMGLSYDRVRQVFRLDPDGAATVVRLLPKPLIRFAARIHREAVPGEAGRIFLPGTPFQATLVDSDFALQGLPEGRFGMRLIGGQGYVYAVRETLDTQAGHSFTAAPDPIGRIDSAIAPAGFGIEAGGFLSATAQESVGLQGKVRGADSNDSRLSILWRLLRSVSADSARIAEPTRLNSQIVFPVAGDYSLELAATLGATTVRDTVQYKVAPAGPAPASFLSPKAGDSIQQGVGYKVAVDAPVSGRVRLEYNYKDGAAQSWVVAADSVAIAPGATTIMWTPPVIKTVAACLLRLRMIPTDSLLAQTPAPFFLVP